MDENTNYSAISTEQIILDLDNTEAEYGILLVYEQRKTVFADMCSSNFMITHYVHWMDHRFFFKFFESIRDLKKTVLKVFSIENDDG